MFSTFSSIQAERDLQALFTTFQFQFPIAVALAQMVVMVPVCYIVAKPRLEWATAKAVFPLAVVNILNVVFGLVGEARTHQILWSSPTLLLSHVSRQEPCDASFQQAVHIMLQELLI